MHPWGSSSPSETYARGRPDCRIVIITRICAPADSLNAPAHTHTHNRVLIAIAVRGVADVAASHALHRVHVRHPWDCC
eukprot:5528615-Prymnesium_polylepis.2